jgi:NADPH:quinone reductase-like Zn-dependent oxidoreductase
MLTTEVVLPSAGEPEILRLRTRELAEPGPGQAVVRMEATGVSFAEQQMRRGKYYDQPRFPFVPGYDVVGTVERLGPPAPGAARDGRPLPVGQRVAALTKTGAWATHVLLDVADVAPVPDDLPATAAETVIVNGVTAWRMLHRTARVRPGQTVVVLGAAGGVGSILVQLARHAGVTVIGTAGPGQQERLRSMGVEAIDYRSEHVPSRVRALAPGGVAAVFDHVGGPGIADSWRMLAPGGTLVSYGSASTRDVPGNPALPVLGLVARLAVWNALPNGRRAHFFNLWAGRRRRDRFRAELRDDLVQLLDLARRGVLTAPIDREFPLSDAAAALRHAEAGNLAGKVVLVPHR